MKAILEWWTLVVTGGFQALEIPRSCFFPVPEYSEFPLGKTCRGSKECSSLYFFEVRTADVLVFTSVLASRGHLSLATVISILRSPLLSSFYFILLLCVCIWYSIFASVSHAICCIRTAICKGKVMQEFPAYSKSSLCTHRGK